jgi:hypothetical protein
MTESVCLFQDVVLSSVTLRNFTSCDSNKSLSYSIFSLLVKFFIVVNCMQQVLIKFKESILKLNHSFINLNTVESLLSKCVKFYSFIMTFVSSANSTTEILDGSALLRYGRSFT